MAFALPEADPFKEQIVINTVFTGKGGNAAAIFTRLQCPFDEFNFQHGGIMLTGTSFFRTHGGVQLQE